MKQLRATGQQARQHLANGVTILADAVSSTLGPSGRNAVLQVHPNRPPHVTKDGVTVAKAVMSDDPFERAAIMLIRQVANKTAEVAGDGTTTATVLARSVIDGGIKLVEGGANAIALQRGITAGAERLIDQLRAMAIPVSSLDELKRVATISANSDTQIGEFIAQALDKVTVDGLITVEEGASNQTEVVTHQGYALDSGFIDPVFAVVNGEAKAKISYQDARVIVTDQSISRLNALVPVLDGILNDGKPIVLIAPNIVDEALRTLVQNHLTGSARILVVRALGFGGDLANTLQDVAALTGGRVISSDLHGDGKKLAAAIGTARLVESTRDRTIICPNNKGGEFPEQLIQRIASLRSQSKSGESEYMRAEANSRLSKLMARVAVIRVGGSTEAAIREQIDRYDDALHAVRAAAESGILPGGGIPLRRLSDQSVVPDTSDFAKGIGLMLAAAAAPFNQIAKNSGMPPDILYAKVQQQAASGSEADYLGIDFSTGEVVNMMEAGIIDPLKVTETALRCAAEVSGLLITTEFLAVPVPD